MDQNWEKVKYHKSRKMLIIDYTETRIGHNLTATKLSEC